MSKVVTVMNMKGGVGKTTVSMNLAGAAAAWDFSERKVYNILSIDYDPQFNLSQSLLKPAEYFQIEREKKTVLSVLIDNQENLNPYQIQVPGSENPPPVNNIVTRIKTYKGHDNRYRTLDLIPSTLDLMYVALGQANGNTKAMETRFEKFIEECKRKYDLIIIDCHPAGSFFTKTSLRQSDIVLIPVIPQKYSFRGIGLMMKFIEAKKRGTIAPKPLILLNHMPRVGITQQEQEIRTDATYGPLCMVHTLKKYSAFADVDGGSNFAWESTKAYSTEASTNLFKVCDEFLQQSGFTK